MSKDLIDRQAAIDSMCELMRHWFGCDSKDEIREIKRELGKLLTIEPERKKGAWINEGRIIRCNECKTGYAVVKGMKSALTYKFCPNCGADMRGEQDETD